ncbi:MAG: helix-turn-helix domain-containing protein [Terriglobales bacterium]
MVYAAAAAAIAVNDPREVLRCLQCQLVQFRTQNNHCRRCQTDLDALPAPPPLVLAPVIEAEPGIETAEASGIPVPEVARAIRLWRQRRGLSQRQLAERMHVPRTYVSKIENDKATPTIASLHRMATAMETSIASLLEPESAQAPDTAMDVLHDSFLRSLLPYIEKLGSHHLGRLLEASRRLATV